MPIQTSQIVVGGYYVAGANQLRKIDDITRDSKKRNRIIYSAKSANLKNRPFSPVGTKANPALESTFAKACSKRLLATDLDVLRKKNILLPGE